ncbi:MAG TPA: phosphoribosylglycinamide synthetase C domain-containing protein, partial [Deltaproteobacteria bacterium]|nr:phosphoribosylglycinamide synthetase C domain-containing protein [Deltaproteobacteria bacterium]
GDRVVVEERLEGEEASFIAVCDGTDVLSFASSQDHKRARDGDTGPNTGGMGAYSPAPVLDERSEGAVMDRIMEPLVWGLKKRGITYRGVIYAGLMMTDSGPYVLEFNVRMGDPETQPLLMRCTSDIVPVLHEVAHGARIKHMRIDSNRDPAVCVVMASEGYPGPVVKGRVITGIAEAERIDGVKVFHAGTTFKGGDIVTSGGRVLGVTATAGGIEAAIEKAYRAVSLISFEGMHYRTDIGRKAVGRLP